MEHEKLSVKYLQLTAESYSDARFNLDSSSLEYKIALEQLKDKVAMLEKMKTRDERYSQLKKWTK